MNLPLTLEVQQLLLSSTKIDGMHMGLFQGRMGLVMHYFDLAYYAKDVHLQKAMGICAEDMLSAVINNIHTVENSFGYGLAGIGWALCVLLYRQQIEGDSDMLTDIDVRISETSLLRCDLSLSRGLEGYIHYILARITLNSQYISSFNRLFLEELDYVLTTLPIGASGQLLKLASEYANCRQTGHLSYSTVSEYKEMIENKLI